MAKNIWGGRQAAQSATGPRPPFVATRIPFSSVAVDDVAGGRMAAEHLCEIGRRRLAFVGGPNTLRQVRDRLQGAQEAVAQCAGASLEVVETAELSVLAGRAVGEQMRVRRAEVIVPMRCSARTICWPSVCYRRGR